MKPVHQISDKDAVDPNPLTHLMINVDDLVDDLIPDPADLAHNHVVVLNDHDRDLGQTIAYQVDKVVNLVDDPPKRIIVS